MTDQEKVIKQCCNCRWRKKCMYKSIPCIDYTPDKICKKC